jgi:hypothetical protein
MLAFLLFPIIRKITSQRNSKTNKIKYFVLNVSYV